MAEYLPKILKFAAAQPIAENCIIIRNSFPKDVPIVCQKSHLHREQRDPSIFFSQKMAFFVPGRKFGSTMRPVV